MCLCGGKQGPAFYRRGRRGLAAPETLAVRGGPGIEQDVGGGDAGRRVGRVRTYVVASGNADRYTCPHPEETVAERSQRCRRGRRRRRRGGGARDLDGGPRAGAGLRRRGSRRGGVVGPEPSARLDRRRGVARD